MKILVDKFDLQSYFDDSAVRIGIGWYRHHKNHKWKGFTIELYLLFWLVTVTYVNNWKEYDKRINWHKYKSKK